MNELQFIDTNELKFSHTKDGVIVHYKNNKFILGFLTMSQKGVDFSETDYLNLATITLDYHCNVRSVPRHLIENPKPINIQPLLKNFPPITKYVSKDIYDSYIRKGRFQLGTIQQYRTIENKKQRDEFEGHAFMNLNINDHIVSSIVSTGFNYLVFCATSSFNSTIHQEQFGAKQLYIENVKGFSESISKAIRARNYFIQSVQYNTLKLYINKERLHNESIEINGKILTPAFFELLKKQIVFPSLFVKPEAFSQEEEVRIVFEMPKDYDKPLKFENKGLLRYIQVK